MSLAQLAQEITACRLCADRFAATQTRHAPRPIFWVSQTARLLICGQAPGMRVHRSGVPFDDPSGDRLRDWMGVDRATFYDRTRIAILPMGLCFPGYDAKGADLPPPKICAPTWYRRITDVIPTPDLTLLVGGYAHRWHLKGQAALKATVTGTVAAWRAHGADVIPLPHPSWRNTGWLKKNPWFEAETLPALRTRVKDILDG